MWKKGSRNPDSDVAQGQDDGDTKPLHLNTAPIYAKE
jgi:hypothetical protein